MVIKKDKKGRRYKLVTGPITGVPTCVKCAWGGTLTCARDSKEWLHMCTDSDLQQQHALPGAYTLFWERMDDLYDDLLKVKELTDESNKH